MLKSVTQIWWRFFANGYHGQSGITNNTTIDNAIRLLIARPLGVPSDAIAINETVVDGPNAVSEWKVGRSEGIATLASGNFGWQLTGIFWRDASNASWQSWRVGSVYCKGSTADPSTYTLKAWLVPSGLSNLAYQRIRIIKDVTDVDSLQFRGRGHVQLVPPADRGRCPGTLGAQIVDETSGPYSAIIRPAEGSDVPWALSLKGDFIERPADGSIMVPLVLRNERSTGQVLRLAAESHLEIWFPFVVDQKFAATLDWNGKSNIDPVSKIPTDNTFEFVLPDTNVVPGATVTAMFRMTR